MRHAFWNTGVQFINTLSKHVGVPSKGGDGLLQKLSKLAWANLPALDDEAVMAILSHRLAKPHDWDEYMVRRSGGLGRRAGYRVVREAAGRIEGGRLCKRGLEVGVGQASGCLQCGPIGRWAQEVRQAFLLERRRSGHSEAVASGRCQRRSGITQLPLPGSQLQGPCEPPAAELLSGRRAPIVLCAWG